MFLRLLYFKLIYNINFGLLDFLEKESLLLNDIFLNRY